MKSTKQTLTKTTDKRHETDYSDLATISQAEHEDIRAILGDHDIKYCEANLTAFLNLFEQNYLQRVPYTHQYTNIIGLIERLIPAMTASAGQKLDPNRQSVIAVLRKYGLKDAATKLFNTDPIAVKTVDLEAVKNEIMNAASKHASMKAFKAADKKLYNKAVKYGFVADLSNRFRSDFQITHDYVQSFLEANSFASWDEVKAASKEIHNYCNQSNLIHTLCDQFGITTPATKWAPKTAEEARDFILQNNLGSIGELRERHPRIYNSLKKSSLINKTASLMGWHTKPVVFVEDVIITLCKATNIDSFDTLKKTHPQLAIWAEMSHKKREIEEAITPKVDNTSDEKLKKTIIDTIRKAKLLTNRQFQDEYPAYYQKAEAKKWLREIYVTCNLRMESRIPTDEILARAVNYKSRANLASKDPYLFALIRKRNLENKLFA
jgi:hypothetical protein